MSDTAIKAENVSKQYRIGKKQSGLTLREAIMRLPQLHKRILSQDHQHDKFWALSDISFDVKQGEVIGIIGRNGSGKSTLLKILSRITEPTQGQITIKGRVASLLEVGTGFNGELTGRENIFLNGSILGMTKREIRKHFDEIVAFSGVENFLDTPVKHYSSGMYVRLAFAVAAHLESEILLVDEVLAVGDIGFQQKCLGKMKDISSIGRTVIFVSHSMEMLRLLCDRCILLDKGTLIKQGDTDSIIKTYKKRLEKSVEQNKSRELTVDQLHTSGYVKIQSIIPYDRNNKKCYEFKMGEPIRFKVSYSLLKNISQLTIHLSIYSVYNQTVITSVEHVVSKIEQTPQQSAHVWLELPNPQIRPNLYQVSVFLGDYYGTSSLNYDKIENLDQPITITYNDQHDFATNYDEIRNIGYFSIESKIINNTTQ